MLLPIRVRDVMSGPVQTASPETTVAAAAAQCSEHDINSLVVTENGTVSRIVTGTDLLEVLGREPDDCARSHLRVLLGSVAKSHPEAWLPALVDLAGHDDPLVRDGALVLLSSIADRSPALVAPELDLVTEALADEATRPAAMLVLSHLAEPYPADVRAVVPTVAETIDPAAIDPVGIGNDVDKALGVLKALAWVDPEATLPAIGSVKEVIEAFASPLTIEDRARWERDSRVEGIDARDGTLSLALEVCALVAKEYSDRVTSVVPHAERVAAGRYYGYKEAMWLLATVTANQ